MKTLQSILLLFVFTVTATAQETKMMHHHDGGDEHVQTMLTHYLSMKEALADDNLDSAQTVAQEMTHEAQKRMAALSEKDVEPMPMMAKMHAEMTTAFSNLSSAETLKDARVPFEKISNHMIQMAKNMGFEKELYVQYCPMAKASWLSDSEEVKNPYYGSQMLKCGGVKEVISPDKQ